MPSWMPFWPPGSPPNAMMTWNDLVRLPYMCKKAAIRRLFCQISRWSELQPHPVHGVAHVDGHGVLGPGPIPALEELQQQGVVP